jgi:hypothetical protein
LGLVVSFRMGNSLPPDELELRIGSCFRRAMGRLEGVRLKSVRPQARSLHVGHRQSFLWNSLPTIASSGLVVPGPDFSPKIFPNSAPLHAAFRPKPTAPRLSKDLTPSKSFPFRIPNMSGLG